MCGIVFIIVSLGADTVMREECVLCRVSSSGVLTRRNEATQEYAEPSREQAVGSGLRRGGVRLLSCSTVQYCTVDSASTQCDDWFKLPLVCFN